MSRQFKESLVEQTPDIKQFEPVGKPCAAGEEIILTYEEMEAIRLADMLEQSQSVAAASMDISSPTFNRILNRARHKIAFALWHGRALRVDGGAFRVCGKTCHGQRKNNCRRHRQPGRFCSLAQEN